jgi:hypothetical protein
MDKQRNRPQAEDAVKLQVDTSEADAVLSILARRTSGEAVVDSDWERLFGSEPYRQLKRREEAMGGGFEDETFRQFVLSDELLERADGLGRALDVCKQSDLEASARAALAYLPSHARIQVRIFPMIKPVKNSFVFGGRDDPMIFVYLDSSLVLKQFENTMCHELHHIGYESVAGVDSSLDELPAEGRTAASWMGAFGEGMAMLAAAGSPEVHPNAHSSPEDKVRWDRDMENLGEELRSVEGFFLDVIDGRLAGDDQIRQKAFTFFGVQGPWYTVGWKMSALVEQCYGREVLIECMLDPRRLLATYNSAATVSGNNDKLPLWSARLLQAVDAHPVRTDAPARGN